tara:strand:+ start:8095 stop:8673 length:579 start_codon:yes stop_codon:yes gene_type:complete
MTANSKKYAWVPRFLRGTTIAALGAVTLSGATILVLWDADFYAVREKFEHLKLAFFGEWQPRNWCPPGRDTANCEQVSEFVAALEDAENFNFFRSLPIEGTDLAVITGVAFTSALDVVAEAPSHLWCYINDGSGAVSRRITLAQMRAGSLPQFTDFEGLSGSEAQALPMNADRLAAFARSHCQFTEFHSSSQ